MYLSVLGVCTFLRVSIFLFARHFTWDHILYIYRLVRHVQRFLGGLMSYPLVYVVVLEYEPRCYSKETIR